MLERVWVASGWRRTRIRSVTSSEKIGVPPDKCNCFPGRCRPVSTGKWVSRRNSARCNLLFGDSRAEKESRPRYPMAETVQKSSTYPSPGHTDHPSVPFFLLSLSLTYQHMYVIHLRRLISVYLYGLCQYCTNVLSRAVVSQLLC